MRGCSNSVRVILFFPDSSFNSVEDYENIAEKGGDISRSLHINQAM